MDSKNNTATTKDVLHQDTCTFQRLRCPTERQTANHFPLELAWPYLSAHHDTVEGTCVLESHLDLSSSSATNELCAARRFVSLSRWSGDHVFCGCLAYNRPMMNDTSTFPPFCLKEVNITMTFTLKTDTDNFFFFLTRQGTQLSL